MRPAAYAQGPHVGQGVDFESVTLSYRETVVLDRFSLRVGAGEVVALIGPSGSGKSTALKAVAGFLRPVSGRVCIGGVDVTDVPPYARGLGMVVQNYALFPHMKIEDNVAFGLRARGASRDLVAKQVQECLKLTGMETYVGRYPRQLSGGQQQRVAIARALAVQPRVLLLDEPLSALDAQIRRSMVEEIAQLHRSLPDMTILYVTHDQSEALTLADRIAILKDGKLCSVGQSQALYQRPPNRFTAEFLGNANLLPVQSLEAPQGDWANVIFHDASLRVYAGDTAGKGNALVCVRPHALRLSGEGVALPNRLHGTVQSVFWQGDQQLLRVDCRGTSVRITVPLHHQAPVPGEEIVFGFDSEDANLVPLA